MTDLFALLISGTVASVVGAVSGAYFHKRVFADLRVLPGHAENKAKQNYSHLGGTWHEYHLTMDVTLSEEPLWAQKKYDLIIKRGIFIKGNCLNVAHPTANLNYDIRGEVRAGRMVITEYCRQDQTEFVCSIYPNLLSGSLLVGIWNGFDFARQPIAAPSILSRDELEISSLSNILDRYDMNLIPKAMSHHRNHLVHRPSTKKVSKPK